MDVPKYSSLDMLHDQCRALVNFLCDPKSNVSENINNRNVYNLYQVAQRIQQVSCEQKISDNSRLSELALYQRTIYEYGQDVLNPNDPQLSFFDDLAYEELFRLSAIAYSMGKYAIIKDNYALLIEDTPKLGRFAAKSPKDPKAMVINWMRSLANVVESDIERCAIAQEIGEHTNCWDLYVTSKAKIYNVWLEEDKDPDKIPLIVESFGDEMTETYSPASEWLLQIRMAKKLMKEYFDNFEGDETNLNMRIAMTSYLEKGPQVFTSLRRVLN